MDRLAEALNPDGHASAATRVSIAVDGRGFQTVIETGADGTPVEWTIPAQRDNGRPG
jgi:hypothetical protein